jgi:Zn-dependent protease
MIRNFISLTPAVISVIFIREYARYLLGKAFSGNSKLEKPGFVKRIDPLGMLMLYFLHFGWSRPYPLNYWKIKKRGTWKALLTATSGSIANFLFGLTVGLVFYLTGAHNFSSFFADPVYNPGSPLLNYFSYVLYWTMITHLNTSLFNLLPFPPLDGSNVFTILLPERYLIWLAKYEIYGVLTLIVLSLLGVIQMIMWPVTRFVEFLAHLAAF